MVNIYEKKFKDLKLDFTKSLEDSLLKNQEGVNKIFFLNQLNNLMSKHQEEITKLNTDNNNSTTKIRNQYEDKIKLEELNNKKINEEKENVIKNSSKKIQNLNNNIISLEENNKEKNNKIQILELDLLDSNQNLNGMKNKYDELMEKLEKEYNTKHVKINLF